MSTVKSSQIAELQFAEDEIYRIVDERRERIADPIRVVALGASDPETSREEAYTFVQFVDRDGRRKDVTVPSSILAGPPIEFIKLLARRSYMWPSNARLKHKIVAELSSQKPTKRVQVTFVPGWHDDWYVLPDEIYGTAGADQRHFELGEVPTVQLGKFRRFGSLRDWKTLIAKGCRHSTRARLAVSAAFAAPNLRDLNISSFGINFSGKTSRGKTLCLRMAASAVGLNSIKRKGPTSWDGSASGFEQRVLGHRDSVVFFDETGHLLDESVLKSVAFRISTNGPKTRAGEYVAGKNLVGTDSLVILISTSEKPIWPEMTSVAGQQIRGEQVRMVNVRACVSDVGDIFDGPNADVDLGCTVDERADFVEKLEDLTLRYQGEAYRAYIRRRAADEHAVETLEEIHDRFPRRRATA